MMSWMPVKSVGWSFTVKLGYSVYIIITAQAFQGLPGATWDELGTKQHQKRFSLFPFQPRQTKLLEQLPIWGINNETRIDDHRTVDIKMTGAPGYQRLGGVECGLAALDV